LGSVFEGGAPTNEEWLIVLLLNSLSDRAYNWLREDLLGFMTNTKITVTSEDIDESSQNIVKVQEWQSLPWQLNNVHVKYPSRNTAPTAKGPTTSSMIVGRKVEATR